MDDKSKWKHNEINFKPDKIKIFKDGVDMSTVKDEADFEAKRKLVSNDPRDCQPGGPVVIMDWNKKNE